MATAPRHGVGAGFRHDLASPPDAERHGMLSDIEIANAAKLQPISEVARDTLGIDEEHLVPYGHSKAKVDLGYLAASPTAPRAG